MFKICTPDLRWELIPGVGKAPENIWDEIESESDDENSDSDDDDDDSDAESNRPGTGKPKKRRFPYCGERRKKRKSKK